MSTKSETRRKTDCVCVCATLRKATRRVTQLFDNELGPSGLRSTQFHMLSEIEATGSASVTDLTRRMLLDQTTLTRSLALLERSGMLRAIAKEDRRLKTVELTRKGRQALEKAQPLWSVAQKRMLRALGPAAWEVLSGQLEQLTQAPIRRRV